jgi:hypothetical protein
MIVRCYFVQAAQAVYSIKLNVTCREILSPLVTLYRGQLKCDGTRAETRFRLSAKRTSPFKLAGASVQSTTGNRGVCISSYCW